MSNPFAAIFGPSPEEVDRMNMETSLFFSSLEALFEKLDEDELRTMRTLISMADGKSEYLQGIITGVLKRRFNICEWHGIDHEREAEAAMSADVSNDNSFAGVVSRIAADLERYCVGFENEVSTEEVRDETQLRNLEPVSCLMCGYHSVSLADRMMREPDACLGCQDRAAHG